MNWITILGWLTRAWTWSKENWRVAWAIVTAILVVLVIWLWTSNATLRGQLATAQKDTEAKVEAITKLQAKLLTDCEGSVDVVVGKTTGTNPCPEVRLKASWDGHTVTTLDGSAGASATAKVGGITCPPIETWNLAAGLGVSPKSVNVPHFSASFDYHKFRVYGAIDKDKNYSVDAQFKLLTGNWP